jgi:hypothetical protein
MPSGRPFRSWTLLGLALAVWVSVLSSPIRSSDDSAARHFLRRNFAPARVSRVRGVAQSEPPARDIPAATLPSGDPKKTHRRVDRPSYDRPAPSPKAVPQPPAPSDAARYPPPLRC